MHSAARLDRAVMPEIRLPGDIQRRPEAFQLGDGAVTNHPGNIAKIVLERGNGWPTSLFEAVASLSPRIPWPIGRGLYLKGQQLVATQGGQFVGEVKRKWSVFVEYKKEVRRDPQKVLKKVDALLNVRFAAPASRGELAREAGHDGSPIESIHVVLPPWS